MRQRHALVLSFALVALATLAPAALARPAGRGADTGRASAAPPAQNRDAPASACTVAITETVGRDPLRLCDAEPVTVTLALSCPSRLPLHVVFVVANHLAMQDHLDEVKQAAREAANAIPWLPGDKAGVVTISTQARKELDLTESRGAVAGAINRIQLDPINPFTKYFDWLGTAQQMLAEAREGAVSPLEAIVVYSTGCPAGFDSYCSRQVASAGKAKGKGIAVAAVCNPNARPFGLPLPEGHCRSLQQAASTGLYHDLAQAVRVGEDLEALAAAGASLGLARVTLDELLAPGIQLVAGSAAPTPRQQGQALSFVWEDLRPGDRVTATYLARAPATGPVALRAKDSGVALVDSLGRGAGPLPLPPRTLNVVDCDAATPSPAPSATPPPTATATATAAPTETPPPTGTPRPAASPTATATATPRPARLALPFLARAVCRPGKQAADIVLALDASNSMAEPDAGGSKLDAAKAAARRFLSLLAARDQAAVLAFNGATTLWPLSSDRAALDQALAGIATQPGTRIDLALRRAAEELASPRARPGAGRVIVLLTDGRSEGDSAPAALAAAAEARGRGTQIYAIGLGEDVDAAFLRQVAGGPAAYYPAPTGEDLAAIYEAIARDLPCPGGVVGGP